MDNNLSRDEKTSLPGSGHSLTRREWVQRMMAGAGAGIATPALAGALAVAPQPATAPTEAAAGGWKPSFLDDPQNQMLMALAERIVPGSAGAQVNKRNKCSIVQQDMTEGL